MPCRELLIEAGPGEWRAALCEDGAVVELHVERGEGFEIGSIHLGRVTRRLPALAASLVEIGGDRPAFLPDRELLPRGAGLAEGERVIVQIRREAQGGKSPRATARPVLKDRFVALAQGGAGLDAGAWLSPEENAGLTAHLERAAAAGAGVRILGAAPVEALGAEIDRLLLRWAEIGERAARLEPPVRLDPPATYAAALAAALPATPERIFVDEAAAIPQLRAAFPGAALAAQRAAVAAADLDALFDEALAPTIALAGGGAVHIEAARAAVLIDVDTGSPAAGAPQEAGPERAALAADLAACAAIARQIRLRNLAGGIVVDFVGLERPRSREAVRQALEKALSPDPARPLILGWTRLGHLELVRPRQRRPLGEALCERTEEGAVVRSAAMIAHAALRAVRRAARAEPGRRFGLVVAPEIAAALAGPLAAAHRALERGLGRPVVITAQPGRGRDRFEIVGC